jgi:hypothetical protein
MKIPIKFAELQSPLFLHGTNLQLQLDGSRRPEMVMIYDRTEKELHVYLNQSLAIIPSTNINSMQPYDAEVLGPVPVKGQKVLAMPTAPAPKGPIKAQVSTPQDHVFRGK